MAISEKQIEKILMQWVLGDSLKRILIEQGVHVVEFYETVFNSPHLLNRHTLAKKMKAEILVDNCIVIAHEEPDPVRAKLKLDLNRWIASKFNSTAYGERLDVNVTQTVDIGSALAESRRRALGESRQVHEITTESVNEITGPQPDDDEDIFS